MAVSQTILNAQAKAGLTNTPAQQAAANSSSSSTPVATTSSSSSSANTTTTVNPKIAAVQVANGMTNTPALNSYNNALNSAGLSQSQSAVYNPSLNPSLAQPNQAPSIDLNSPNVPNTANNMDAYTKLMEKQTADTKAMLEAQAKSTQELINQSNAAYKKSNDALQTKLDSLKNTPNQQILDAQAKAGRFGTPAQQSAGNQEQVQQQNKTNLLNQINSDYRANPNIFSDEKTFQQHYGYEYKNSTERVAMMQAFQNVKGDLSGYNSTQLVRGLQAGDFSKSQLDNLKNTNPALYDQANNELRLADDEKYYNEVALDSNWLQERLAKSYEPVNKMMQSFMELATSGTNVAEISNMYLKEENEHPELKDINTRRNELDDKIKEITRDQESLEKDTYKAAPGVSKSVLRAEMNEDMIAMEKRKKDLYDESTQLDRREQQIRKDMETKYKILSNNAQIESDQRQQKMQALQFSTNLFMDMTKQQNDIIIGDYNFQRQWTADMKKIQIQNNLTLQSEARAEARQIASEDRSYNRTIETEKRNTQNQKDLKVWELNTTRDFAEGNINSKDYDTRLRKVQGSVDSVLKQYPGIPIQRSREQIASDVLALVDKGMSLGDALTQNLIKPIQGKPEYTLFKNAQLGIEVNQKPYSLGQDIDGNPIFGISDGSGGYKVVTAAQLGLKTSSSDSGGDFWGSSATGGSNAQATAGVDKYAGTKDGRQCGQYTNDYCESLGLGRPAQNDLKSKVDDINSKKPVVGAVAVMDVGTWTGHVGIVKAIDEKNSKILIKDSNWKGDEKIREHRVSASSIMGYDTRPAQKIWGIMGINMTGINAGSKTSTQPTQSQSSQNTQNNSQKTPTYNPTQIALFKEFEKNPGDKKLQQQMLKAGVNAADYNNYANTQTNTSNNISSDVLDIISVVPASKRSDKETEQLIQRAQGYINKGMSVEQAKDAILGYNVNTTNALTDNLRQLLTSNESTANSTIMRNVSSAINAGNSAQAVQVTEKAMYAQMSKEKAIGETTELKVRTAVNSADNIMRAYNEIQRLNPKLVGNFGGSIQEMLTKFGDPASQKLASQIESYMGPVRNELMGASLTAGELKMFENVVPKLSDKPEVFVAKLQQLKTLPLAELNSARVMAGMKSLDQKSLLDYNARVMLYMGNGTSNQNKSKASAYGF